MIFISTGTIALPFNRLIDSSINVLKDQVKNQVIIQSGTYQVKQTLPKHISIKPYFTLSQTIKYYKQASLVISAAGEASVFLILKNTRFKPVFMPRLKHFGEHVDNLQLATCDYLKQKKLTYVFTETSNLQHHLPRIINRKTKNQPVVGDLNKSKKLLTFLDEIT